MRYAVGTSGWAYKEWRGSFYPADCKPEGFLRYYATQLRSVEINNTFYRMPTEKVLAGWAGDVPDDFTFVLKAPQRITHLKRLRDSAEDVGFFTRMAGTLGPRLGPTLFLLPPSFKQDVPRLAAFLALLPAGWRAAFEFRHASWFTDETYDALRARNAAMVVAEADPDELDLAVPFVATADWGYLRLRRVLYTDADIAAWAEQVRGQAWTDAFVFFKHEDGATGPALARKFTALLEA